MDSCDHAFYQDGELYRYKEKDDGTEEKEICEALRCSRCGYVLKGREIVEIPSDDYWIGEDGTVMNTESAIWDLDPCSHGSDVEGTIYEHRKDTEGGCRTEVFSGLRCSVCGQIRIGTSQYEITYPFCVHRYQNDGQINEKEW